MLNLEPNPLFSANGEAALLETEVLPSKAPIVIFELEIPPEERSGRASGASEECQAEKERQTEETSPLRWVGSIEAHLGYAPGEFAHTFEAWCAVLHPDDLPRILEAIEAHLKSEKPFCEPCRAQTRDGNWLSLMHSGVATRDEQGVPWKFTGTLSHFELTDAFRTHGRNRTHGRDRTH